MPIPHKNLHAVCLPITYTYPTHMQTDSSVPYLYLLSAYQTMHIKSDPPYLSSLKSAPFSLPLSYIKEYHINQKDTIAFMYFFVHIDRIFFDFIRSILCIMLYHLRNFHLSLMFMPKRFLYNSYRTVIILHHFLYKSFNNIYNCDDCTVTHRIICAALRTAMLYHN